MTFSATTILYKNSASTVSEGVSQSMHFTAGLEKNLGFLEKKFLGFMFLSFLGF